MAGASAPTPQARRRREPLRPLRLFWIYFRIGALNELQYRANLAVQVFQSLIALGTGLAVLGLVYSQTTTLGGCPGAVLHRAMMRWRRAFCSANETRGYDGFMR